MSRSRYGTLEIRGAAEHNLKRVSLEIPKNRLVVFTGPSGSGKSSLAFDTLYAEGQRRYIESLSSYARQFLGQMEKPRYDHIRGLSPTISIEQKAAKQQPTVYGGHDHRDLRLPPRTLRQDRASALPPLRETCGASVRPGDCGPHSGPSAGFALHGPGAAGGEPERYVPDLLDDAVRQGFSRMRIDGEIHVSGDLPVLEKNGNTPSKSWWIVSSPRLNRGTGTAHGSPTPWRQPCVWHGDV